MLKKGLSILCFSQAGSVWFFCAGKVSYGVWILFVLSHAAGAEDGLTTGGGGVANLSGLVASSPPLGGD
ncbi:hypothetical protein GOP47_0018692 [Adiantum capillus-veneris]|uniref:Uncharacterized protein n=1 Tax=Adiantum capillus-veneris TaxID=13818 RepID=A0A9D4Z8E1_ADICA|nr:hypothetical protein GOP47_0018692 [Adiantum capillus-veneris]